MSRSLDFRLLGPLEVREGDVSLALGGRKQRTLLAILLLHANEVVSGDTLIHGLWGEHAPKTAGTALQVYVSNLRKLLPPERLETRTPGYVLHVEPEELDLARFERLAAKANGGDSKAASTALDEALALWHGQPLADFAYEPFARAEIARLEELRMRAIEQRIDAELELGRHAELVGELEALVSEHPYREHLRQQLMLALYRSDRQTEALEAYRRARLALLEELGIEPGPALKELEKAILAQDVALEAPAPAPHRQGERPPPESPRLPHEERKHVSVLFAELADVFSRFTPGAVAEQVLAPTDADPGLAGVSVECTVMFIDLRGFTPFSESLPPTHVIEVLNVYREQMTEAILDHSGRPVSYEGDAIMAVFGAPIEQPDHADRAIAASREVLSERLPRFNAWLRENELGDGLRVGIGLNSGTVVSGTVGSERRPEYAAIGETTNIANRLETMTKGQAYLLYFSDSTRQALRRDVDDLVFVNELPVRDYEPVKIWSLLAASVAAFEAGKMSASAPSASD
jgi:class 3 adenylate cyclase/DNA-binding SARP family transcriptional activator